MGIFGLNQFANEVVGPNSRFPLNSLYMAVNKPNFKESVGGGVA